MGKLLGFLGIAIFLVLIYLVFNAYFVFGLNEAGQRVDGFGRVLTEAPWFAQFIGAWGDWPGLQWHLIDMAIFWPSIILAVWLCYVGFGSEDEK